MRYLIGLSRWLRKNRPDIDLVCVSHLGPEAHTVVGALAGSRIPVVIRAEANESLPAPPKSTRHDAVPRSLRRCFAAQAHCGDHAAHGTLLLEWGVDAGRIRVIANGVDCRPPARRARVAARRAWRSQRRSARAVQSAGGFGNGPTARGESLAGGRRSLEAGGASRGRMPDCGSIGDGPQREELYRRIREADL